MITIESTEHITLKELLYTFEIIDKFEDIQLVSCRTGEYLTSVDYLDDSGFYEIIENYLDRPIICIVPRESDAKSLYLEIRLGE